MKCKAWVIEVPRRKKGSGELTMKLKVVGDAYDRWKMGQPIGVPPTTFVAYPTAPTDAKECGGDVKIEVGAAEEPYMGGVSAVFEVMAICQRCGHTYHGTMMPGSAKEVSHILTEWWNRR